MNPITTGISLFLIRLYIYCCNYRGGYFKGHPRIGVLDAYNSNNKQNQPQGATAVPKSTTRQTVRISGKRTVLTTRNGKVTAKPAEPLEWELQASQCRTLRAMPSYGKQFTMAARMEAGKRGPKAQAQAVASGMVAGEPDMAAYGKGGRILLWENKVGNGRLSPAQTARHALLASLGHPVHVLRATTAEDAAAQAVALVTGWLCEAANDNYAWQAASVAGERVG